MGVVRRVGDWKRIVRICKGRDFRGVGGLGSCSNEGVKNGMKWKEEYRIWMFWRWFLVFFFFMLV